MRHSNSNKIQQLEPNLLEVYLKVVEAFELEFWFATWSAEATWAAADGNIYKLFGSSTIVGRVASVTESEQDDTLLWHMRLGHIGERGTRELQINMLAGV